MSFPVIIGSYALSHHLPNVKFSDVDLLVSENDAKEICYKSNKKEGKHICLFECDNMTTKVDITNINFSLANKLIYDTVNKLYETQNNTLFSSPVKLIKIIELGENEIYALLPSIEILYVIKKSHIHRILPIFQNNKDNIDLWKKHVNMYSLLRNNINYEMIDEVIYGPKKYGLPMICDSTNDDLNISILSKIFIEKFSEVTNRVGDTSISMDKQDDDFFKDNVKRYIHHDDLHKKIAMMCRNSEEVLYDNYKVDKTNAQLDMDLFLNADKNELIQCIREEIMVLFLERKWIIQVMKCNVETKIPIQSNKYDIDIKHIEIDEIIAHFSTNLCGQGHSWLRQYVIDHHNDFSNLNSYDLNELFNVVLDVTNVNDIIGIEEKRTIDDMIKVNAKNKLPTFKKSFYKSKNSNKKVYIGYYSSKHNNILISGYGIDIQDAKHEEVNFELGIAEDYVDEPSKKIINIVRNNGQYIFYETSGKVTIYNLSNNFGMEINYLKCEPITLFYCNYSLDNRELGINGEFYISSSDKVASSRKSYSKSYSKVFGKYYYYSEDDYDCGWKNKNQIGGVKKYLSSYGILPKICGIELIIEHIARFLLDIKVDTKPADYDSSSNANSRDYERNNSDSTNSGSTKSTSDDNNDDDGDDSY